MKKQIEILLPKLGETLVNAVVVQWLKKEGDEVKLDEALLEVSTDKVNSEIPSPCSGTLKKILAFPGDEKSVGDVLAIIETEDEEQATTEKRETIEEKKHTDNLSSFYSPALINFAKEHNLSYEELDKIPRSSSSQRLSKKDVQKYLENNNKKTSSNRIKMSNIRKQIADNMEKSFYTAPHASLIAEVDVTELINLIEKDKKSFSEKTQAKLTITAFLAKMISNSAIKFPLVNTSLEEDTIIMKKDINVGIAVQVEEALAVPVIEKCNSKTITEIAKAVYDLAKKARENKLSYDEMQKGTITLSNFGMTGIDIGIPIIRYPEVAIIAIGCMKDKVVAIDNKPQIRKMMNITLTFDHRVFDGIYGCDFLNDIKKQIENCKSYD